MSHPPKPLRCAACNWEIGKRGTHTGRYRELEGWSCIFCLSRFVELKDQRSG